jgi:hypothetical protein
MNNALAQAKPMPTFARRYGPKPSFDCFSFYIRLFYKGAQGVEISPRKQFARNLAGDLIKGCVRFLLPCSLFKSSPAALFG